MDADGLTGETSGGDAGHRSRTGAEPTVDIRLDTVSLESSEPTTRTFNDLVDEFDRIALAARPRKKSTLSDYRTIFGKHLRPWFGLMDVVSLSRSPHEFERYAAAKLSDGLAPKTVRNHLMVCSLVFKTARRWRWVAENPLELVPSPTLTETETETLTRDEIANLLAAYTELECSASNDEQFWLRSARCMTIVALSTGLRRGELLGLRWRDVDFVDGWLHVRQQFVRCEIATPKSRAGRRTIPLGEIAASALKQQNASSAHWTPDSIVFSHPTRGTPLDPSKLTRYARKALAHAGIASAFRPWHGLRHTALTETAAAGIPAIFVQAKAGHAQASTTERYLHANRTSYPDAAKLAEARLF